MEPLAGKYRLLPSRSDRSERGDDEVDLIARRSAGNRSGAPLYRGQRCWHWTCKRFQRTLLRDIERRKGDQDAWRLRRPF
jgi:hypothetical protein